MVPEEKMSDKSFSDKEKQGIEAATAGRVVG
jgi:hypothetical protein